MEIIPIIQSCIDWRTVNSWTKTEPTASHQLDTLGVSTADCFALPHILHELYDWDIQHLMDLVSMAFVVKTRSITEFLSLANFIVVFKSEREVVLSATMRVWVEAILRGCSPSVEYDTRLLANKFEQIFSRSAVAKNWRTKRRTDLKDGTFILV